MIYENDMEDFDFPFKAAVMKGNQPFMNHCHQELEIIKIQKGALSVLREAEKLHLQEGDIWIVPPFISHGIGKGDENCERLVIMLDLQILGMQMKQDQEYLWLRNELEKTDMYSGQWKSSTKSKIDVFIEQLYEEYLEKEYAWKFSIKTLISQLTLTAIREMPKMEIETRDKSVLKIKDILEYIALHYYKDISLGECAKAVGFNSTYLSRYFRQSMGITFQEYIKRLRIDRAKWLLMTEKISITEICAQSGFRDVKTFNKLFKKECRMSPSQFRKNIG